MKSNHYTRWALIAVMFVLVGLGGCAGMVRSFSAQGEPFRAIPGPPPGKALIVVYRPSRFVGAAVQLTLMDGEKAVTSLLNAGYYVYPRDPGPLTLWAKTEVRKEVSISVEAGKTYFVKGGVSMGLIMGRPQLREVSREEAFSDLPECAALPGSYKDESLPAPPVGP